MESTREVDDDHDQNGMTADHAVHDQTNSNVPDIGSVLEVDAANITDVDTTNVPNAENHDDVTASHHGNGNDNAVWNDSTTEDQIASDPLDSFSTDFKEKYMSAEDLPQGTATAFSLSMPAILILIGTCLSSTDPDNLAKFGTSATEGCEFKVRLELHPYMYARISINIYANILYNGKVDATHWLGRLDLYFESLSDVTVTKLSKDTAALSLQSLAKTDEPIDVSFGSLLMSLKVCRVLANFEQARIEHHDEVVKRQIEQLVLFINSINGQNPGELDMYVEADHETVAQKPSPGMNPDTSEQPVGPHDSFVKGEERLDIFRMVISCFESKVDPLRIWFSRSPNDELLNAGTIPRQGESYEIAGGKTVQRPHMGVIDSVVKFYDVRQYKIAQVYSTLDDAVRAEAIVNETEKLDFDCYPIVVPHRAGGGPMFSTVAIAVAFLPRKGTDCQITLDNLEREPNEPYPRVIHEHLPGVLRQLIDLGIKKGMTASELCQLHDIIADRSSLEADEVRKIEKYFADMCLARQTRVLDDRIIQKFVDDNAHHHVAGLICYTKAKTICPNPDVSPYPVIPLSLIWI
ncbi:hypothetical protein F4818DRAFT_455862 [Hypoxylon cercidicola]|nr:hypothetical protein F4818DRAFT_455862 [Hypoxylon cercidicola]